jgi:hypothetical protein
VVERVGAPFSLNMLSAISPHGEMRVMVNECAATAETFSEFLKPAARPN